MTCEEALKRLYEIVDNEADQKDKEEIKEHLQHCRHCMSRYEFEELFKKLICDKVAAPCDTSQLKKNILNRIDQAEKSSGWFFSNPLKYKSILLASAAALIICVMAAFATAKFYRHKALIYPFELHEIAYDNYAGDPIRDISEAPEVYSFISDNLRLAMGGNIANFNLINAGFDNIRDHDFAHLRFENSGNTVSVFMGHHDDISIPDFDKKVFEGIEYFQHICKECQVIYWYEGDALIVVVSENLSYDLTSFIPALSSI